ncbi:hypothetical protein ACSX1A_08270 [Pontibacter sp. MBLB2868]|uniref:hypothetical protein n=1 Tax=Pontibacter sp. MBLB2868 TaxID=3451555 RepID=UPI003F75290E
MKAFFLSLLFASSVTMVNAQQTATEEAKPSEKLLKQFNGLKENANSYREGSREYKVVSVSAMDAFWNSVEKNIKATESKLETAQSDAKDELQAAQTQVEVQKKQIEALKKDNALKDEEVRKSDSISVFGLLYIPKQAFVILMLSIIAVLVLILAVVYYQFKNSKQVTDEKKRAFEAIDQELNDVKKNARERELKLKRDLQTEMNRIEELNHEITKLQKRVVA